MNYLTLKVATPEKLVLEEEEIESLTLPTSEGEITVLPQHIPIVTQIAPGEVTIRKKGREESLLTLSGFLKVDKEGNVVVLSDYAIRSEDVELAKVEEAKKKAEQRMKEKISEEDFTHARADLTKALLELKVAKRRKASKINI